jgi:ketosteroid isomerase-like protein
MNHLRPVLTLLIATASFAFAQSPEPGDDSRHLFGNIAKMDASMFDAFNAHDSTRLMSLFTDDLEFYHDKGGLTNYEQTADNFKKLFASAPDIRRELVPGTLEVYPIKDYGAIEVGVHRFTHHENGREEIGSFKFLQIWRKTGDSWKVSRVISYGH